MDTLLKAKWTGALRSGEYEQATGSLTDGHGFCCLGVLCEVAGLALIGNNQVAGTSRADDYTPILYLIGRTDGFNPNAHDLTMRNDGIAEDGVSQRRQYSFAEIADYIDVSF